MFDPDEPTHTEFRRELLAEAKAAYADELRKRRLDKLIFARRSAIRRRSNQGRHTVTKWREEYR